MDDGEMGGGEQGEILSGEKGLIEEEDRDIDLDVSKYVEE